MYSWTFIYFFFEGLLISAAVLFAICFLVYISIVINDKYKKRRIY